MVIMCSVRGGEGAGAVRWRREIRCKYDNNIVLCSARAVSAFAAASDGGVRPRARIVTRNLITRAGAGRGTGYVRAAAATARLTFLNASGGDFRARNDGPTPTRGPPRTASAPPAQPPVVSNTDLDNATESVAVVYTYYYIVRPTPLASPHRSGQPTRTYTDTHKHTHASNNTLNFLFFRTLFALEISLLIKLYSAHNTYVHIIMYIFFRQPRRRRVFRL